MKNLNEEELKIKFNNYMEQIKVPENLGGIIMEDFEKIKNEENQTNTQKQEVNTNENTQEVNAQSTVKKKNGNKVLKISLGSVAAVVLVGAGILVGTKLTGDRIITFNNHGAQNSNLAGDNNVHSISTEHLSSYLGKWYSEDTSLEIKSLDNDKIQFDLGLFRLAAIDDAIGTLKDKTKAEFTCKFDESYHEASGVLEFKDDSIILTFTSSSYKDIPLDYKFVFIRKNKTLEKELVQYVGKWRSKDGSTLEIINSTENKVTFKLLLYRLTNIEDITVAITDAKTGNFTGKNDYDEDVSGTISFENGVIRITFTSNSEHIKANTTYTFLQSNDLENSNYQQNSISITEEEKHQLQVFLNKQENNPWTLLTYNNPKDVLSHNHNVGLSHEVDAAEILRYSIKLGGYGKGQENVYGTEPGFVSSQEDMNRFFKEKLFESNFTDEEIQKAFKNYYNKDVSGKYTFWVSDTCYTPVIIENSYKISENSYSIKLDHGQVIELRKDSNGNYLFYSCTGFNGKIGGTIDMDITENEKTELTAFLNKQENNPWTLLTYTDSKDILSHTHNVGLDHEVDAAEILRYSIKLGGYGKGQENVYGTEPGFVSSQEDMNRFFKEKLFEGNFTDEEIQKAFKNYYNKNVSGKYTFWVSDTCYTPVTILSGKKTYDDRFILTLNHGQNIILIKDSDGKYKFYHCTGFDGKIGE